MAHIQTQEMEIFLMIDVGATIEPKSDQLNSDDLIAGPITVTIRKVAATGDNDQPVSIFYEGDNNKPYKACKSMRRVLVAVWGRDGTQYVGKSMTLFREPTVKFGGLEVGGIRISHMSHIEKPMTIALTATRGSRKPYTVKPLVIDVSGYELDQIQLKENALSAARQGKDALQSHWKSLSKAERGIVSIIMDKCKALAIKADERPEVKANEPEDSINLEGLQNALSSPVEDYDDGNITDETQTEDIF
jgi:hypothetical protein